jgi:3-oxoacyl-[acyl-carrier-protein] synthase-3
MKKALGIAIIGTGQQLGSQVESNETLCKNLSIEPSWIEEKTGITQRFLISDVETASSLAVQAAKKAITNASIDHTNIDLIICCTFSADYKFPALAAKVHQELKCIGGQVFDIQVNCAGFVTGLTVAAERMKFDSEIRNALVIGVEINSAFIDRQNLDAVIYHSDGAGAVILGRVDDFGLIASSFHTDSTNYEAVRVRGGGSLYPYSGRQFDINIDTMELNGIATWKQAITHLPAVIRGACTKANINIKDLDFMIFHQANLKLIEYIIKKNGLDLGKTYTNVQAIGNTGAASPAIALDDATKNKLIKYGDKILFAAVGAGFTFGASIWRWAI